MADLWLKYEKSLVLINQMASYSYNIQSEN